MPKAEIGDTSDRAMALQYGKVGIESDLSQNHNYPNVSQQIQFPFEIRPAITKFLWPRFVAGRRTVDRSGNPGIVQFKTVISASALRLRSKTGFMKGSVEEVTGTISSEHTSSTISTMCSRRQAKDQEPSGRITERRHRSTPVIPIEVRPTLSRGDFAAVRDETRAALALYNFPQQRGKVLFVTLGDFK
ncbi:MAG TPA: hypothetical protein VK789_08035 [Bryobacteraceae bacterium]|jgi:hypothetical protein|nr:hypothetical protein [Bryobacteraceae bacterium]